MVCIGGSILLYIRGCWSLSPLLYLSPHALRAIGAYLHGSKRALQAEPRDNKIDANKNAFEEVDHRAQVNEYKTVWQYFAALHLLLLCLVFFSWLSQTFCCGRRYCMLTLARRYPVCGRCDGPISHSRMFAVEFTKQPKHRGKMYHLLAFFAGTPSTNNRGKQRTLNSVSSKTITRCGRPTLRFTRCSRRIGRLGCLTLSPFLFQCLCSFEHPVRPFGAHCACDNTFIIQSAK